MKSDMNASKFGESLLVTKHPSIYLNIWRPASCVSLMAME